MSKLKSKSIFLTLMLALFSFFIFGCEGSVKVESIYFLDEAVVLLQGETYSPKITVEPTYASDGSYTITSLNTKIVSVKDNMITAVSTGTTSIKVISNENSLKQDIIKVTVRQEQIKLTTPNNLLYNHDTQTFSFDAVDGAVSYKIKINDTEIELGNITQYSLRDYDEYLSSYGLSAYDRNLTVQVMALKPDYTIAYQNSNYSSAIKVHQAKTIADASIVGGVLNFEKTINSNEYRIDFVSGNITETLSTTDKSRIDLTAIDEKFAGSSGIVKVYSLVDSDNKTDFSVRYYNSLPYEIRVSVLDVPNLSVLSSNLKWQDVGAGGYDIYLDGTKIDSANNNSYDLMTYRDIDSIDYRIPHYELKVKAVLSRDKINVLNTDKKSNAVYFNRINKPTLTIDANSFTWGNVDYASAYVISLRYTVDGVEKEVSTLTSANSLSLDRTMYQSNNDYTLSVYAVNTNVSGNLTYLPSFVNTLTVKKQSEAELSIADYHLNFVANSGEKYRVIIDNREPVELIASDGNVDYDLSSINFDAGEHTIAVVHLGDGINTVDSNATEVKFTQYETIDELTLANSTASVVRSALNEDAIIRFKIKGASVEFEIDSTELTLNSTDSTGNNYIPAGDYVLSVYVLGDGERTFSVRENGNIKPCVEKSFKVLDAPVINYLDKDREQITFTSVDGATIYDIFEVLEQDEKIAMVTHTSFDDFEIASGESRTFRAQAKGDGSSTLDSVKSNPMRIYRLSVPSTTFDSELSAFVEPSIADGEEDLVLEYELRFDDSVVDYVFGTAFNDLLRGENYFSLKSIAVDGFDGNSYLNSQEYYFVIDKIDESSNISINHNNQLVIVATNHTQEYGLYIKFVSADNTYEFTSNEYKLVSSIYSLDYSYVDGVYTIDLFGLDYLPIIRDLDTKTFNVEVKFLAKNYDNMANSEIEISGDIGWASKTVFNMSTRDEQYVIFNNVETWRSYTDYAILVNDKYVLYLNNDTIIDSDKQVLKVDIKYIYDNTPAEILKDINTLAIITRNTDTSNSSLKLSSVGSKIRVGLSEQLELEESKPNSKVNNSVVVSFATNETVYDKIYIVEIYNKENGERTNLKQLRFNDSDAISGRISFNLDDHAVGLTGDIYISAQISANGVSGAGDEIIYIFNSSISNELHLVKIDTVLDIHIDKGVLRFEPVENAVGYDIYKQEGAILEKLNKNGFIINNYYQLRDMEGDFQIRIKAISQANGYTNADLSAVVNVHKFATPIVSIKNGNIVVTLSSIAIETIYNTHLQSENSIVGMSGAVLHINNGVKDLYLTFDLDGVELDGNDMIIDPTVLINYGINSIVREDLIFEICVDYSKDEVYYLNSNSESYYVHGIFEPTSLDKTTTTNVANEYVEHITWTANNKNAINGQEVTYGYVAKIVCGNNVYLTNDELLKFTDGENVFNSYPSIILSNNFIFPYGYDINMDGEIGEGEKFGPGVYKISVRAVPKDMDNYNLVSSRYSKEYTIEIMQSPKLVTNNGVVVWDAVQGASSYFVRIYDVNVGTVLASVTQSSCSFDFTSADFSNYVGVYGISVQALSDNKTIINSDESLIFEIFRMNEADSVSIDDGKLILYANAYFDEAEIEFVDTETGRTERIYYTNESSEENLAKLGIIRWTGLSTENQLLLQNPTRYVVNFSNSEILNIMGNRSYRVNVLLRGNSLDFTGIVSSRKSLISTQLNVTKLAPSLYEVNSGVLTYSANAEYIGLDMNYNFDTGEATNVDSFWNKLLVYQIKISSANKSYSFYTIDYDLFEQARANGSISSDKYTLINDKNELHALIQYASSDGVVYQFNVFKNNRINLKNYDMLYYYPFVDDSTTWTSIDFGIGGSFVVEMTLLGGDSIIEKSSGSITSHIGYLTANPISSKQFVRYKDINSTITTYDGILIFEDLLTRNEDGNVIDYPVYRLTFTPINTSNTRVVYIYYTEGGEAYARSLAEEENALFVQAEYSVDLMTSIMFDMSQYFESGTYLVDIRTLAGEGNEEAGITSSYLLNARVPTTNRTIYKIGSSKAVVSDGKLVINMGAIDTNSAIIEDYEVIISEIVNGEVKEYILYIDRDSAGVTFNENTNTIIYELPNIISAGNGNLVIENGKSYSIKVRGLARDNLNVVNATYDESELTFTLSSGVSNVRIENGKLRWQVLDKDNYQQVMIKVSFLDENGEIKTIKITTTGSLVVGSNNEYEYTFADSGYRVEGSSIQTIITYGIDYSISVRTLGKSGQLDSNYSTVIVGNRLQRVPDVNIKSHDGILMWDMISDAHGYIVTVSSNEKTYTFTTKTNQIDFLEMLDDNGERLPVGDYTISIRAIGTDRINSILTTSSHTFTRLAAVTNISISSGDSNSVKWDAVDNAQGYLVQFLQDDQLLEESVVDGTSIIIPDSLVGRFSINIKAVGVDEGYVFNGDFTTYVGSFERPEAVSGVVYDRENNRYYFTADDFLAGDKLRIRYDFREYVYNNSSVSSSQVRSVIVEYTYANAPSFTVDGRKYYYFAPQAIGEYTNLSVQIDRNGLYSSTSPGENVRFDIFGFGDGSESKPYGINSANHLLAIAKYSDKHFIMYGAVDLSDIDFADRLRQHNAIISTSFSGVFDGNGRAIYGLDNVLLDGANDFALFGTLDNAVIKNLSFGIENKTSTITSRFTNNLSSAVRMSLLAVNANNSTIENVSLRDVKLVLSGTGELRGGVYIAGLIINANNSTIIGTQANVNVQLNCKFTIDSYVGGLVAKANGSVFNSSESRDTNVTFSMTQGRADMNIDYIGGIVAYLNGGTVSASGVFKANVNFTLSNNIYATNIGGIAGFATKANMNENIITGSIVHSGLSGTRYIGGVVGLGQDLQIFACDVGIDFNITISNSTGIRIGAVAGYLTASTNGECRVDSCVINVPFVNKTEISSNTITKMGVYGDGKNNIIVVNCKQK